MVLYRNTRLSTITQSTSIQVQYNESFLDSPNSSNHSPTKINVKKSVVYLQLITAKWHIENSKNNER